MRYPVPCVKLAALRSALLLSTALTIGVAPAFAQSEIVLVAAKATKRVGRWSVASDPTSLTGSVIRNANHGAAKRTRALASPRDYFEITFQAQAGTQYRLWVRGKAQGNYWGNDSIFVQFNHSVNASGAATYRIGSTSAAEVNLESCQGCGISGWVWQDNGYGQGILGPTIRFSRSGEQKLRIQPREDGITIDEIILSPDRFLRTAPTMRAAADAPRPAAGGSSSSGGSSGGSSSPASGGNSSSGDDDAVSAPAPSSTARTLKVLDWNIHHGVGTDGRYDIDRIATAIASTGAQVVSLNEVERFTGWGNEDQPARFASLLRAKTGKHWSYKFAQNTGAARGQGNLLLTTYDIEADDDHTISHSRAIARIAIIVNGIRVNIFSTHLDPDSSSRRSTQMREVLNYADNYPEQRIILGDFNAWPGASEIRLMTAAHNDSWAAAQRAGTAVAFSGNAAGNTRNSRIDYIWESKGASRLTLKATRVFDKRDSRGVMPSDHRPVMATFEVR